MRITERLISLSSSLNFRLMNHVVNVLLAVSVQRDSMRFLTELQRVRVNLKTSTDLKSFAITLRLTHFVDLVRQLLTLFFQHFVISEMNISLTLLIRDVLQAFVRIFSILKLCVTSVSAAVCVQDSVLLLLFLRPTTSLPERSFLQ